MEQNVLKNTRQAINDIKNRVFALNKFVCYLEKVQQNIKIIKYDRILLIDKNYVDKIYLDRTQTDILSLVKNKNEKTDLEEMLLWHTILATLKKELNKKRNTANAPFNEIESFYAYAKYEISFSNIYKQIIELQQSIAIMKDKIKVIYENRKYVNREAFVNNPNFESIVNTKEMHFQNGLILNELGEYLIIENYYCTNIDLSPIRIYENSLGERLLAIKITLEKFMPSLLDNKEINDAVCKYTKNVKLMACFFKGDNESYDEYSKKHIINKDSLKAYISKVANHKIDTAILKNALQIRSFLAENYSENSIENFDKYLNALQRKK